MLPPEGADDCDPLETFVSINNSGGDTLSHWQMSAEELAECNRNGGRVWVKVCAYPTPPIAVFVKDPFE